MTNTSLIKIPSPDIPVISTGLEELAIESARDAALRTLGLNSEENEPLVLTAEQNAQCNHLALRKMVVAEGVTQAAIMRLALRVYANSEWTLLDLETFDQYVNSVLTHEDGDGPIPAAMRKYRHLLRSSIPVLHALDINPVKVVIPGENGDDPEKVEVGAQHFIDRPSLFQEIDSLLRDVVPSTPKGRARIKKAVTLAVTAKSREELRRQRFLVRNPQPPPSRSRGRIQLVSFLEPTLDENGNPVLETVKRHGLPWERQRVDSRPGWRITIEATDQEHLEYIQDVLSTRVEFVEES
ncbi:MAG: hypothetical protein XU15_C0011G0040 [candidate division NC10 bacterium CSP1-5]|nr:MAG: hypothetical protein XU15_C0011G0040 [candidate division NC10 bacterium CSP1-5]